jgi:uncharacterized protein YodC (DUF2158 family)
VPQKSNHPPPFPVGSAVRVRVGGPRMPFRKRALAGTVGAVVAANAAVVIVDFAARRQRESFRPSQLEPAEDPSPRATGKRK